MNDSELQGLFSWAEDNLTKFEIFEVDESTHFYFEGTMIGGWAGDTSSFFYVPSHTASKMVALYDAWL